jgi:hypothetical protein
MKYTIPLLLLIFMLGQSSAGVYEPNDLSQAYAYLNQVRLKAGMTEFSQNQLLEMAAFNHANYLVDNSMAGGHFETAGLPGFTGVKWNDRTAFVGYRSLLVSENVSSGDNNSTHSIDELMSAIYHRFGFLDFINNEVGIGIGKVSLSESKTPSVYVYNMSNAGLNALCEGPGFSGFGRFYTGVCTPEQNIEATDFENIKTTAQGNNPIIVMWPVEGDDSVPPAFFEESPDPLPDYSVSGYPISLQFNPLSFTEVNVTDFRLYREADNFEVQPTRLLDQSSDPNGKFSELNFALFPLERLDWDTIYRVEAQYTTPASTENLVWRFKTKDLGVPIFTVQHSGEIFSIPQNQASAFAVYVPPTSTSSEIGRINFRFFSGTSVNTEFEDGNTLRVNISANIGQEVTFILQDGREFIVQITAPVEETLPPVAENTPLGTENNENNNLPSDNPSPTTTAVCEPATLSANLNVHIPVMHYTFPGENTPSVLWADLEYIGGDLLFKMTDFGFFEMTSACEGPAILSSDVVNVHIPTIQYTSPEGEMATYWVDLEFRGEFVFQVKGYGL